MVYLKKIRQLGFVAILCLAIYIPLKVQAVDIGYGWNGGGSTSTPTSRDCQGTVGKYCVYNNGNHNTMQISLYYFDGSGNRQLWASRVLTSNDWQGMQGKFGWGLLPQELAKCGTSASWNASCLQNTILANNGSFFKSVLLPKIGSNIADIETAIQQQNLVTEKANPSNPAKRGFRLILEPVLSFYIMGSGTIHFDTPKSFAGKGLITTNESKNFGISDRNIGIRAYTNFTDVGIQGVGKNPTTSRALIANPNMGYGMNIVDLTDVLNATPPTGDVDKPGSCLCPSDSSHPGQDLYCTVKNEKSNGYDYNCSDAQKKWCYDKTIENLPQNCPPTQCVEKVIYVSKVSSTPAVCTRTNANNEGIYTEYYDKKIVSVCDGSADSVEGNATVKGRYIRRISNYCHLYCLESAETSFPGNIADSLALGSKLVWPTSSSNYGTWKTDLYPLTMKGTMSCRFNFEGDPNKDYNELKNQRDRLISEAESLERKAEGCHYEEHSYESCSTDSKGVEHCSTEHETVEEPYDGCHDDLEEAAQKRAEAAKLWTQMEAIRNDMWSCLSSSYDPDDKDIYNFQTGASVYYDDDEYGQSVELKEEDSDSDCEGCNYSGSLKSTSGFPALVNGINNRVIKITKTVTFGLPDNLYQYVNKKDLTSASNVAASELANYYKINYSNLPLSWTATLQKNNYHIGIQSITLGHNGRFSSLANTKDYTCKYNVANTINGCQCPEGTTNAGKDLYCKIKDANDKGFNYTCSDGQVLWCNSNDFKNTDQYCGNTYCPNDPTINISSCVLSGQSYSWCVSKLCKGKYECPSNTPNAHMDITPCVQTKVAQGYSLQGAIEVCEKVVCPAGLKIVYRTIDLANPFPAKDKDHEFPNLATGMFNYNVKGRYPGTNWNSKLLVSKEILKNRGVKANDLYAADVTPLYTITLDPKIIGKIRAYNKKQKADDSGYGDFTLDCTNGSSCISNKFLRQTLGNYFTDGTCKNGNKYNFYKCSEVKS